MSAARRLNLAGASIRKAPAAFLHTLCSRRAFQPVSQKCGQPPTQTGTRSTRQAAAAAAASAVPQAHAPDGKHFWRVVVPTGLTMLLCNMDRICMSIAILPMSKAFGWSPSVQGTVQAAFLYGYTVTQLLGGSLADKYGGRRVIAYAIKVFSAASLVLPLLLRALPGSTLACVVGTRFLGAPSTCPFAHNPCSTGSNHVLPMRAWHRAVTRSQRAVQALSYTCIPTLDTKHLHAQLVLVRALCYLA